MVCGCLCPRHSNKQETIKLKDAGYDVGELVDEEMRSHLQLRSTDKNIKNIGTKKHKASN